MSYPISDVTRRVVYSGSAGTGPYSFSFEVLANTDIAVYKNTTLLTLTTDYTVTINVDGTGSITLVSAATGSDKITLVGDRSIERATDFVTGGDLFANTLNDEFDSLVIFSQQIDEKAERGLKAPVTDPTDVSMVLPAKETRASKYLAFDSDGNPVAAAGTSETPGLGTMSTQNANAVAITGGSVSGITDLAVADGGTGASTASQARTNLGTAASGANSDITSLSGLTTALSVAQGGTGAATLTANNVLLGNGTSALQAVAPSTSGNVLTSNGTTWTSAAPASGGVTSVATGNGLSGGTITSTGTLVIACPTFNTVGSYVLGYCGSAVTAGSNYSAGGGGAQVSSAATDGTSVYTINNLSGTWKAMGGSANPAASLFCRVS